MPYPMDVVSTQTRDEASIGDFQTKEDREKRRVKSKYFWNDPI